MTIDVLDPTHGEEHPELQPVDRLTSLDGLTVGIVSNGKQGTRPFFDAFERELRDTYGVAEVVRRTKTNYSAPADPEIMDEATEWSALVSGIGD
ncbi:MAG: hypothetical protein AAF467_03810 [Actinomycetota bacterium]